MENRTVVIHQPDFLPYLGFFHRLLLADVYIVLDNVQFTSGSSRCMTNRDKIKTPRGEEWVTVPCRKCPMGTNISDVRINNGIPWKERNLGQIEQNYRNAPGFSEIFPYIEKLYAPGYERLVDLTFASIRMLISLFGIEVEILFSSDLKPEGKSNERVVSLVRKAGAARYLSGIGAKGYFDQAVYDQAGIEVLWQDFEHPVYPQQHGGFIPCLSSIDLLLNCGMEKSREILRGTVA